jgi:uncharacterized phage-associated protein
MLSKTADLGGDTAKVTGEDKTTVDAVIKAYGSKPAHFLSELTHSERPWRSARKDVPSGASSTVAISHEAMAEFYESLLAASRRR